MIKNALVLLLVSFLVGGLLGLLRGGLLEEPGTDYSAAPPSPVREPEETSVPTNRPASRLTALLRPAEAPPSALTNAPGGHEAAEAMIRRLRAENDSLRTLSADLQEQLGALFTWMIDNYKGRYPLRESQLTNLQFQVLSDAYELNPAVAEFMNLSDGEIAAINDLFNYGVSVMDELIQANMTVTDSGGGRITIHIPPFSQEGALVREDLFFGLETTLGAGRFDRFLDVTARKFEEDFHYFGNASHTIMLQPTLAEDGRTAEWLIRDGWIIHETPTTTVIRATENIVRELPAWYYQYMDQ